MHTITLRAPINTGNRFCGPAAISAITGVGTAEAASVIRSISGQRAVKGTSYSAQCRALNKLGYDTRQLTVLGKPTLAGWLKLTKSIRTAGRVFLVCAGNHWQVISGRRYVCGIVKEVISVRDDRVRRRARVARVWEIIKTDRPALDPASLKPKRNDTGTLRKALALAKRHDIEVEKHWNDPEEPGRETEYWVYKPEWLAEENDPADGDHLAHDWTDMLKRVETYVSLKP